MAFRSARTARPAGTLRDQGRIPPRNMRAGVRPQPFWPHRGKHFCATQGTMALIDFVSLVHKSTKRDYLGRVTGYPKAEAATRAKEWGYDYWDGDRRIGYGGGGSDRRWREEAKAEVDQPGVKPGGRGVDVGRGQSRLPFRFHLVLPP